MSAPRPRWSVWVVLVAVALAGGAVVVTVSASSSESTDTTRARLPSTAPASPSTAPTTPTTVESLAEPRAQPPVVPPVPARQVLAAAERAAGPDMSLGVAVLDVHTGEPAVGRGGAQEFMSASLSKLIVAVDVLDRRRAEGRPLDPADLDLIDRALSASDDNAMNALWGRHDGAGAIGRVAGRLGLTAYLPPDSTETWGDTVVTATDMVTIYRYVLRGMAPQDRAVIVDALASPSTVAVDGFGQHYGLLHEGASPQRYAKQAWVPYAPAGYLLHSAGVAYDGRTGHAYAIALLSIQPYTDEQTARDRLSTVAAAALARLTA
ncbi:MAG: serine hydrolase [Actinophytocola sp.]|uniref:serine hydrolase n=1 Tax=Actinophytocola sp. TaxID=1872138 RepID=UPI003D6AAB8E